MRVILVVSYPKFLVDTVNLSEVISILTEERGLDAKTLESVICEGVLSAYQKKLPDFELKAKLNRSIGEVVVTSRHLVVAKIQDIDPVHEVVVEKARKLFPAAAVGDEIWMPVDAKIGRIEILKARQVIAAKIREIEVRETYEAFRDKQGSIIHGIVYKLEGAGTLVKIRDTLAFLPHSLSIPSEQLVVGHAIKALLKEVLEDPKGKNQLILDRASTDFLKELFVLEIPEVYERLVEIKKIVRNAGYKSKVIVDSSDQNIDPVGTCVGVGGSRIKPILKEIGGEKIDIIGATPVLEELVKQALKPAKINRVEIEDNAARVWVDEDQRALVVGRSGQNIMLAARLLGMNINLAGKKSVDGEMVELLAGEVTPESGEAQAELGDK